MISYNSILQNITKHTSLDQDENDYITSLLTFDNDVKIALERGLKVYYRLEDVPMAE